MVGMGGPVLVPKITDLCRGLTEETDLLALSKGSHCSDPVYRG